MYCNCCKRQGHDETTCRILLKQNRNDGQIDEDQIFGEKYRGNLRQLLNERRGFNEVDGRDIAKATHDVVVAGQSNSHQVCLEATVDRPNKEKMGNAYGATGLTIDIGATGASSIAALIVQGTGTKLEAHTALKATTDSAAISVEPVEESTGQTQIDTAKNAGQ